MPTRQYVGARYVPTFANPIQWDNQRIYEPLTVVTYLNNSYTSKKPVPQGVDINNTEYWVLTGNYNAQVEQYRQEVEQYRQDIENIPNPENVVTVCQKGGAQFTDITSAFNYAKTIATPANRVTILVYPGVYEASLDMRGNLGIDIIGIDRNLCRIQCNTSEPAACIYTGSTMTIANLTLINNGTGYAVHLEAQDDDSASGDFRAINCHFQSSGHAGLGAGFGPNFGADLIDCKFVTANSIYAAMYCHNHPSKNMESALRCTNCTFENGGAGDTIIIENAHKIHHPNTQVQSTLYLMFRGCTSRFNKFRFSNGQAYGYIPNDNDGEVALIGCCGNTITGLNNGEGSIKLGGYGELHGRTMTIPVPKYFYNKYDWSVIQFIGNSTDDKDSVDISYSDNGYIQLHDTGTNTDGTINYIIQGNAKK